MIQPGQCQYQVCCITVCGYTTVLPIPFATSISLVWFPFFAGIPPSLFVFSIRVTGLRVYPSVSQFYTIFYPLTLVEDSKSGTTVPSRCPILHTNPLGIFSSHHPLLFLLLIVAYAHHKCMLFTNHRLICFVQGLSSPSSPRIDHPCLRLIRSTNPANRLTLPVKLTSTTVNALNSSRRMLLPLVPSIVVRPRAYSPLLPCSSRQRSRVSLLKDGGSGLHGREFEWRTAFCYELSAHSIFQHSSFACS